MTACWCPHCGFEMYPDKKVFDETIENEVAKEAEKSGVSSDSLYATALIICVDCGGFTDEDLHPLSEEDALARDDEAVRNRDALLAQNKRNKVGHDRHH